MSAARKNSMWVWNRSVFELHKTYAAASLARGSAPPRKLVQSDHKYCCFSDCLAFISLLKTPLTINIEDSYL